MGGGMLLPNAIAGGTPLLGRILRIDPGSGRPFAPQLPPRKRHRTLGLQQLQLHTPFRRTLANIRKTVHKSDSCITLTSAYVDVVNRYDFLYVKLVLLLGRQKSRMATDSLDPAGIYFGTNTCPSPTISLRFPRLSEGLASEQISENGELRFDEFQEKENVPPSTTINDQLSTINLHGSSRRDRSRILTPSAE